MLDLELGDVLVDVNAELREQLVELRSQMANLCQLPFARMEPRMFNPKDLLGVIVADPGLVDQHPDAAGGVGLRQLAQVLAVLRVGLETHLEHRF